MKYVWGTGGMLLPRKTRKCSENTLSQCHFVHHEVLTNWPPIETRTRLSAWAMPWPYRPSDQPVLFRYHRSTILFSTANSFQNNGIIWVKSYPGVCRDLRSGRFSRSSAHGVLWHWLGVWPFGLTLVVAAEILLVVGEVGHAVWERTEQKKKPFAYRPQVWIHYTGKRQRSL